MLITEVVKFMAQPTLNESVFISSSLSLLFIYIFILKFLHPLLSCL